MIVQRHNQDYTRPRIDSRMNLEAPPDVLQPLADAEQTESVIFVIGGIHGHRIETDTVVFNAELQCVVIPVDGHIDALGLGMLDDIEEQLTTGLENKHTEDILKRLGCLIVMEPDR
jgi:hypothetical protein